MYDESKWGCQTPYHTSADRHAEVMPEGEAHAALLMAEEGRHSGGQRSREQSHEDTQQALEERAGVELQQVGHGIQ